jgi:GNAT superfamily N-acetyltransferase
MEEKLERLFATIKEGQRIGLLMLHGRTKLWIIDLAALPFLDDEFHATKIQPLAQLRSKRAVIMEGSEGVAFMSPAQAVALGVEALAANTTGLLQQHWYSCCNAPTAQFHGYTHYAYVWRQAENNDYLRVRDLARQASFFEKQINQATQELQKKGVNLETRRRISPERPSDFMVLELEATKEVIGFCLFSDTADIPPKIKPKLGNEFQDARYIYIAFLFVSPSERGRGLARFIVDLLRAVATAHRKGVVLEVEVSQRHFANAKTFWEAMGFRHRTGKCADLWYFYQCIADPMAWLKELLGGEKEENEDEDSPDV